MEPFTLVERNASSEPHHLFDDVVRLSSAKTADHDLQYVTALREANPGMIVTTIPTSNVSLRTFAAAGYATCELDTKTDSFASLRGYISPAKRSQEGQLGEAISFAKYHYIWSNEHFILYCVGNSYQFVLKECRDDEHVLGPSTVTDRLIKAIGNWIHSLSKVVWVYDDYWRQDAALWKEVQKSNWDDVILDEDQKKELTSVTKKFFASKQVYDDLGVPWKRGLMFYGPPGNGKTISIRALMHELYNRKDADGKHDPIPTLYVKRAPLTYDIREVFSRARALAPCMLVLEDIETIVNSDTRSYFFNEMDGLENNDGLFVVASTNFLDKLDPGLSKRPSRFDRKYKFPLPSEHERILYCEYWRQKLKSNDSIDFPEKLSPAMANITPGFSFAFLQECFVATLLVLAQDEDETARSSSDARPYDDDNDDLDDYKLWVTFKEQADTLRKEVEGQRGRHSQLTEWLKVSGSADEPSSSGTGAAGGASGARGNCHGCCRSCERCAPSRDALGRKGGKEMLPELPWYDQKRQYINSAATELKPMGGTSFS